MVRLFRIGIKKFLARIKLLSLELLIVIVSFFAALAAFVFITKMVFLEKRESFDVAAFSFLEKYVNSINTGIMQFFSMLGSHYFLIPANLVLVVIFVFLEKYRWYSIKIPAISLSSLLLMQILKQFFHRDRPLTPLLERARGLSFPSGHALMSATFYGLLIYITWKSLENKVAKSVITAFFLLLIFFIGISRIYLRVHYASDVLAGFSLGLIWLVLSVTILGKMEQLNRKEFVATVEK